MKQHEKVLDAQKETAEKQMNDMATDHQTEMKELKVGKSARYYCKDTFKRKRCTGNVVIGSPSICCSLSRRFYHICRRISR